jgi:tetratricopeptide (TPR) repeat protein
MKLIFIFLLSTIGISTIAQKDSAIRFFNVADTAFAQRKFALAEKNYIIGLRYDSTNLTAINNIAVSYVEMRKYNFALPYFTKLYNVNNDLNALTQLAVLTYNARLWDDAIKYNTEAIAKNVGTKNNYRIAQAYFNQEDYANSSKYLGPANKEEPNNPEIPYLMANVWLQMQNNNKAIEMYKIALTLNGFKNDAWLFELGSIYEQLDSLSQAAVYYEKAIENGATNNLAMQQHLGICYVSTKQYEKGIAILDKVIAKKPKDKTLFEDIGYAFYNNNKFEDAIKYWDEILKIDPNDARSLYMIGIAYRKKGDDDKGARLCDAAIQMDPKLASLRKQMQMPTGAGL